MALSDEAVLIDPINYDPVKHGPPYLPSRQDAVPMTPSLKLANHSEVQREAASVGEEIEQLFSHFRTDYAGVQGAELAVLLAALRAEAMVHQAHHWATSGPTYYADHLLFDRLYSDAFGLVDGLAERAIGTGQAVLVQPLLQTAHVSGFMKSFYRDAPVMPSSEEMVLLSYRAVLRVLVLINLTYQSLEGSGALTHGLDNILQGMADQHEQLVYLLKQRSGVGTKTAAERLVQRFVLHAK